VALACFALFVRLLEGIFVIGDVSKSVKRVAAVGEGAQVGLAGWKNGEILRIDDRRSAGSEDAARSVAHEILALKPDVILGQSAAVTKDR
jgi:hypothetical protein